MIGVIRIFICYAFSCIERISDMNLNKYRCMLIVVIVSLLHIGVSSLMSTNEWIRIQIIFHSHSCLILV